ncbi:uncharacterized protein JN550_000157 [Neoarthrinium moseri]|uniref:uncharacterized protein n=1 Tax=Neoarthrinium moseri TaxID=1658444 RepID=UPI001FDE1307|nr:uncharacterized protein JN550_000157 [Neoarthrinium moseri]KAI1877975.1 hypothetical protein JN550_000157 [Neoarthrinium moseri]
MNISSSPFRSLAAQLGRLSIGVSRTTVRLASSKRKRRERIEPDFVPGHGEKIWIFSHLVNGTTVYSHNPVLKANKALRQLPYNGKKLKPAKIRKDYWRPLAMIQFPEGMGHVGRSVFHIMREFRQVHDLAWEDSMFRDDETNRVLTRHERGEKLNRSQKPNAIADMAAVLAGAGKGNKMWTTVAAETPTIEGAAETTTEPQPADQSAVSPSDLVPTTVFWADELDKNYAKQWPTNVTHSTFADSVAVPIEVEEEIVLEAGENGEDGKAPEVPVELVAEEQARQSEQQQRPRN